MNSSKLAIALMLFLVSVASTNATAQGKKTQTETFKVWGNCGMCEKTIEKSLKVKGIVSADLNKETKMITVVFDPKKITLSDIHKKLPGRVTIPK